MQTRYHLRICGRLEGPFTTDGIEDLHGAGQITKDTPCKEEFDRVWRTLDELVPRAKWATSPRERPPSLIHNISQQVGDSHFTNSSEAKTWWRLAASMDGRDFGSHAVAAGIVCVTLQNVCSQLMQGFLFAFGAVAAGVAAMALGRIRNGALILVAVAATCFFGSAC